MGILPRITHVPSAVMSIRLLLQSTRRPTFEHAQWLSRDIFRRYSSFSPLKASLIKNINIFSKSSKSRSLPLPLYKPEAGCGFADKTSILKAGQLSSVFESSDAETADIVLQNFELHENLVSEEEENSLLEEVEDYLEDLDYEYDHWDNAIHGYRETEKSQWSVKSQAVLRRIRQVAFSSREQQLSLVHVLDLAQDGYIKPHVDSVKFCGSTITGVSLLSTAIMRLAKQNNPEHWVNVVLKPRSLYVIRDVVRYQFTHEILKDSESSFRGQRLPRARRISIICRNEPS
ncbi:alpha-ketoglutarate-dependent dioxygenase alkB homolog 7, mitochondrial-like isoform X1 [Patiria miniata]|uniref:Alpha-ketoglutarate-dependent dioxygenase AlkB-like domain-containing protein n=1 Tax=Patiria miniata TaxID=46514 RepID=A0A913ZXJ2_PATMI|nr:alpha-ketoglutarate-dependent dioxygenase alkB homolog 7, mitochondrial-like isoform X1 [Patiria miniata]